MVQLLNKYSERSLTELRALSSVIITERLRQREVDMAAYFAKMGWKGA